MGRISSAATVVVVLVQVGELMVEVRLSLLAGPGHRRGKWGNKKKKNVSAATCLRTH